MTYLNYVNIILQALNEVPLTSQQLASARGFHQFAKEAVNRTYFDIIGEFKWPWMQRHEDTSLGELQLSGERTLVPQDAWTLIPVANPYSDAVDWSSIYYRDADGDKQRLKYIDWEEYEDGPDYHDTPGTPNYIVQSADGRSMGLIPFPDGVSEPIGTLHYRIWGRPSRFEFAADVVPMPDLHFNVLVDGALSHVWAFRGDVEQAQYYFARFEKGIKRMKQKYTNQTTRLRWA